MSAPHAAGLLLIVSGDDFGAGEATSRTILGLVEAGDLTSVSAFAPRGGGRAPFRALAALGVPVGIHLNLTEGRPLSPPAEVRSLVDAAGDFPGMAGFAARLCAGAIRAGEVEREFDRQLERLVDAGIAPTHADTHEHIHLWPSVLAVLRRVTLRHGVTRVRNPFGTRLDLAGDPSLRGLVKASLLRPGGAPAFARRAAPLRCPDASVTLARPDPASLARLLAPYAGGEAILELVTHPVAGFPAPGRLRAACLRAGARLAGYGDV